MTRLAPLALLLAVACGGSDPVAPPEPVQCSQTARTGTYLVTYTTLGGDCGDIPPTVSVFDAPDSPSSDCVNTFERWSADQCTVERTRVCVDASGVSVEMAGATKQETTDGARITGTVTATMRDGSGAVLCTGTYRMSYVRQ